MRGLAALAFIVSLSACEAAKSANPTAPTVAGPIPVVTTAAPVDPIASSVNASSWTTEQWQAYVMGLAAAKGGSGVSDAGMAAMRPDLLAHGADFQNGWRGDLRPRLFLPVVGCPAADRPDVPPCSYDKTVDLGGYGEPWQWIPRF